MGTFLSKGISGQADALIQENHWRSIVLFFYPDLDLASNC